MALFLMGIEKKKKKRRRGKKKKKTVNEKKKKHNFDSSSFFSSSEQVRKKRSEKKLDKMDDLDALLDLEGAAFDDDFDEQEHDEFAGARERKLKGRQEEELADDDVDDVEN